MQPEQIISPEIIVPPRLG